eukprot:2054266-Pleurochrysis_carterae.AAC.1
MELHAVPFEETELLSVMPSTSDFLADAVQVMLDKFVCYRSPSALNSAHFAMKRAAHLLSQLSCSERPAVAQLAPSNERAKHRIR